jgi:hypothetical protein
LPLPGSIFEKATNPCRQARKTVLRFHAADIARFRKPAITEFQNLCERASCHQTNTHQEWKTVGKAGPENKLSEEYWSAPGG